MKSIIALAAVLALVGTAQAAPMNAKAKTSKAASTNKATSQGKRKVVKKHKKVAAVSRAELMDAESQMSERAKLSDVKPLVQAKKWSAGFDAESYAPMKSINNSELGNNKLNDGETDYAAKVAYKIEDTLTVSAAAEWAQMWGANNAEGSTTLLDPSLRISKSKLADLGNGVGLNGQARIYLPVSQASQDKEQIAVIRLYATASREISKAMSASFTLNPRIYLQQNDTYINADGATKNVDSFRLLSSAGVKYSVNDMFAIEQTFGLYQKWKTNTDRGDYLDASSSMYFAPANWVELNLGIRQTDEATNTRKAGLSGLYSADQAEYYFIASFSI